MVVSWRAICHLRLVLLDEFEELVCRVMAVVGPGADLPEHASISEDFEALEGSLVSCADGTADGGCRRDGLGGQDADDAGSGGVSAGLPGTLTPIRLERSHPSGQFR